METIQTRIEKNLKLPVVDQKINEVAKAYIALQDAGANTPQTVLAEKSYRLALDGLYRQISGATAMTSIANRTHATSVSEQRLNRRGDEENALKEALDSAINAKVEALSGTPLLTPPAHYADAATSLAR